MQTFYLFFASRRYWPKEEELDESYEKLKNLYVKNGECGFLITDEQQIAALPKKMDCAVIIPMSGDVQRNAIEAAQKAVCVIVFSAYVEGNASPQECTRLLFRNAAPTVMDIWSVLRRTHAHAMIAIDMSGLQQSLAVMGAWHFMQNAKILLIGDTEPWVISNASSPDVYKRLGVTVIPLSQSEVVKRYRATSADDAAVYYKYFFGGAKSIEGPSNQDIVNSCRMACVLVGLLQEKKTDGMALACFNLLKEGTNSCLGVSYINDKTPYVASCEGDVDSLVTMLAMKRFAKSKVWMANPGLHPEGIINFSHCTAPVDALGCGCLPYTLRHHHESGIGTSLQVEFPAGLRVTACRISDEASKITIQNGTTVSGKRESACRTQVYIKLDDFDHYLDTALGCHQVFVFENIAPQMRQLAKQLGLELL